MSRAWRNQQARPPTPCWCGARWGLLAPGLTATLSNSRAVLGCQLWATNCAFVQLLSDQPPYLKSSDGSVKVTQNRWSHQWLQASSASNASSPLNPNFYGLILSRLQTESRFYLYVFTTISLFLTSTTTNEVDENSRLLMKDVNRKRVGHKVKNSSAERLSLTDGEMSGLIGKWRDWRIDEWVAKRLM